MHYCCDFYVYVEFPNKSNKKTPRKVINFNEIDCQSGGDEPHLEKSSFSSFLKYSKDAQHALNSLLFAESNLNVRKIMQITGFSRGKGSWVQL